MTGTGGRSQQHELQRTVSRAPKKIAQASLECLKAGASVCPGGVLEDEAEEQKMLQIDDAEQLEQAADSEMLVGSPTVDHRGLTQ